MSNIAPWQYFAFDPGVIAALTPLERAVLARRTQFRLTAIQQPPHDRWHFLGYIAARGMGKTLAAAYQVQARVDAQAATSICLIAQDEQRTNEICVDTLINISPPWNKAARYRDVVLWRNGAVAYICTPEAPSKIRGANYDLAWMTEVGLWSPYTAEEAYNNASTATRIPGHDCRIIWDTTAKGVTPVLETLMRKNRENPDEYPIIRGTTFDNPLLGRRYLKNVVDDYGIGTRKYREEILGEVFDNADGAIFQGAWIHANRVDDIPPRLYKLIGFDPNLSDRTEADAAGIVIAGRTSDGQLYVLEDRTAKHSVESVGNVILDEHAKGATGVVLETNAGGRHVTQNVRAAAQTRGVQLQVLTSSDTFPERYNRHILYVREVHNRGKKLERAEPIATLYSQGRVHHVGTFPDLEKEQLTYDGNGPSPNNFDACNMVLAELAGLNHDTTSPAVRAQRSQQARRMNDTLANLVIRKANKSVI